jgi:DNA-binding PadR family transcriptional regulator
MLSTKHVVLGLMAERQGYGYELQQRLGRRFGFLGISETAIYSLLTRMERDGLIVETARRASPTARSAPRVTYTLTPDGEAEFRRWMVSPCDAATIREELHAKLIFSRPDDLPALIEMVERQEREFLAELQALARGPRHDPTDEHVPWSTVAALLVDDAQAARLEASIGWLQRARAVMESRQVRLRPVERGPG